MGNTPQAEFLRALAGGRSWKKALQATGLADDEAVAVLNEAADRLDEAGGAKGSKRARSKKAGKKSPKKSPKKRPKKNAGPPLPPPPAKSPYTDRDLVLAHADGASRGNPGPASYGCVYFGGDGRPAFGEGEAFGTATNNVAEYRGCLAALTRLAGWKVRRARVRLDSQLVVRQLQGSYRVKDATLRTWYEKVRQQAKAFEKVDYEFVPRAENRAADKMANWALDAAGE